MMHVLNSRQELLSWRDSMRTQRVGFVPTMGNLHTGHLSLIENIRPHCMNVLASIYVNPMQFSPSEDYHSYPRTLEEDLNKLASLNANAVFVPADADVYADDLNRETLNEQDGLMQYPHIARKAKRLCGISRPDFFFGVINVVSRLFSLVRPDSVCFGEKDFQQYQIIKEFCKHQFPQIKLMHAPTKREQDGLAMSSRNVYLDKAKRLIAPKLWQQMQDCRRQLQAHAPQDYELIIAHAQSNLEQQGFEVDYFELCDEDRFVATTDLAQARLFAAVYLRGARQKVRLIDNIKIK